ncbi:hypothetical protein KEM56_006019, partial [Ascosphaera pollenicola]
MAMVRENGRLMVKRSAEYSDFVIECQGQKFPAHKVIVCAQSAIIHAAVCNEEFLVYIQFLKMRISKSSNGVYRLDDYEPDIVDRMLDYLYTGHYLRRDGRPDINLQGFSQFVGLTFDPDDEEQNKAQHVETAIYHSKLVQIAHGLKLEDLLITAKAKANFEFTRRKPAELVEILQRVIKVGEPFDDFDRWMFDQLPILQVDDLWTHLGNDNYSGIDIKPGFKAKFLSYIRSKLSHLKVMEQENEEFRDETRRLVANSLNCEK